MSGAPETAYAKINLALHVRERLPDGYHSIETVFAFCEDGDELAGEPAGELSLSLSGPFAAELHEERDNIVLRAGRLLQREAAVDTGAAFKLSKNLPVAAGLGGGSADAAAALRLLNRVWGLDWQIDRLEPVARQLGADVPACLYSHGMRGEGRGDQLSPVELDLAGAPVLLVNPRCKLPTAEIYGRWDGFDRGPLTGWRRGRNDLEDAAASEAPLVRAVLAWLNAQSGTELVRMSGSGASCFALFDSEQSRDAAEHAVPREWWRLATRLR